MAAWPVPHWQASSERAQPAAEMAEVRQGIAQLGSAPKFWAETRPAVAITIAEIVIFILTDILQASDV